MKAHSVLGSLKKNFYGLGLIFCAGLCVKAPVFGFTEVDSISNPVGDGAIAGVAIDTTTNFLYYGSSVAFFNPVTQSSYSFANQAPLAALHSPNLFQLPGITLPNAIFIDSSSFVYFASSAAPAAIGKISRSLVSFSSGSFSFGQDFIGSAVVDPGGGFAYLGTLTTPAAILKIRLSDLTEVSSVTVAAGQLSAAVIDTQNGFAYFGSSTPVGTITKIGLSSFTVAGFLSFNVGEGGVASAAIDVPRGFAYFATVDSPGKVMKVQLSNFTRTATLTLSAPENQPTSAILDPVGSGTLFLGCNTAPGIIAQVGLFNFIEMPNLILPVGQNFLTYAAIDVNNEFGYFGTNTNPGIVAKIDLLPTLPTIQTQPVDQSAKAGNTATFTINVQGRSPLFQWQANGVNIAGATASSYTTPPTALTDDGTRFRCLVTNTNGTTTSSEAVLTVLPVIRVYPNPWRVDRHSGSLITLNGLAASSTIKIYTLSGHWIKTLPPASGVATWDVKNDVGESVASGYYFYVVTTVNSRQTVRGKIAIIQ